jgi:hypothetical protein
MWHSRVPWDDVVEGQRALREHASDVELHLP